MDLDVIRGTCRAIRHRRRLSARMRWSAWQSALLLVLAVIVTVSGLWDWLDLPTRIRWHAISGFILIGVLVRHAWTRCAGCCAASAPAAVPRMLLGTRPPISARPCSRRIARGFVR
jgi:hypothetical protein